MAETETSVTVATERPNFLIIAVSIIVALVAMYLFFLRTVWVPVLVDLDPQDASAITKVLDEKKIGFRFAEDGRTIEVAEGDADRARIELAGSELPMKGQIGFELFNQSDMGLTEFAQKVNFQRALQGELARTILLLDGIQTARVHLGMPERSVFRGEQEQPKASVTLILRPGKALSSATVLGIQRLVAGAIPDMSVDAVAVLDGTGRLISNETIPQAAVSGSSDAVIESARKRLNAAIAKSYPDLKFSSVVSVQYRDVAQASPEAATDAPKPAASQAPRGVPDYAYAVRLTSEQLLDEGRRSDIQRLAAETIDFDPARGDKLAFLVGPVIPEPTAAPAGPTPERIVAAAQAPQSSPATSGWRDWWIVLPVFALLLIGVAIWSDRRRAAQKRSTDLGNFTELLRQRLDAEAGA